MLELAVDPHQILIMLQMVRKMHMAIGINRIPILVGLTRTMYHVISSRELTKVHIAMQPRDKRGTNVLSAECTTTKIQSVEICRIIPGSKLKSCPPKVPVTNVLKA